MRRLAALAVTVLLAACQTTEVPRPVAATIPAIERPRNVAVRDDVLKSQIVRRMAELGRPYRSVTVEAWGGRVLLMGAVIKPEQRRKAEQTARAEGAAEVLNELVLAEDKALDAFTPDPTRDTAARRALGMDGSAGIIIRVINGVAFLLGATANAESAAALKADATEVEGVKWVVSHLTASTP